jgi:L-asparagine transporter-like permease
VAPLGWGAAAAVPVVIFSMMGSEVATIAAVETADPRAQRCARGARSPGILLLSRLDRRDRGDRAVGQVVPGFSPFTSAMQAVHVPGAGAFMTVVVFTAVLSASIRRSVTSRMLFEMAGRGDARR